MASDSGNSFLVDGDSADADRAIDALAQAREKVIKKRNIQVILSCGKRFKFIISCWLKPRADSDFKDFTSLDGFYE